MYCPHTPCLGEGGGVTKTKTANGVIYSSYLKFGNVRARVREPYGERRFFSAFPKIKFSSDCNDFFFVVAIMGSIKLIFFRFSIKGRVGLKWIPKFGNTQ
jgi:hypothetical protein